MKSFTVLVGATGPGGSQSKGQKNWTLYLSLAAWRETGEPVVPKPIRLESPVTSASLNRLMNSVRPYSILSVKGRLGKGSTGAETILATSFRSGARDDELTAFAAHLKKPVKHRDAILGVLTFDRAADWYAGTSRWQGRNVEVALAAAAPKPLAKALTHAHNLWASQRRWTACAKTLITSKVLADANSVWRLDDDPPFTKVTIVRKLSLRSITVHPSGAFEMNYAARGVFGGHELVLHGKSSGTLNRWELIG